MRDLASITHVIQDQEDVFRLKDPRQTSDELKFGFKSTSKLRIAATLRY